ncbi:hypothetical protein HR060_10690 [Catenovulum sp. SM1970]|uniref:hypothetical protein n=1 Tax=Marinifaba aquimaris TaxID=2741323 RepID=UPI001572BD56|nr:hypothetical protein [Marinifaba aquimaris]NTS77331.1 hypothetical protein [Marinifaba aquimaris]
MNFDNTLNLAIQRSPRLSGASAADKLQVTRTTFSRWVRWRETGKFPGEDKIQPLAELTGLPINKVYFAVMAAKCGITEIQQELEALAA